MKRQTVAAVIPAHPARLDNGYLVRALTSVARQTYPVDYISVAVDRDRYGAAVTRDRALAAVPEWVDWVAFLDSDDDWAPIHIEALLDCAQETGADYVYSWFMVRDWQGCDRPDWDPFPGQFGKPWDDEHPVQTTVTTLVRRELAQSVGFAPRRPNGVPAPPTPDGNRAGEDWRFTLGCMDEGAKIVHLPQRTWYWYHHSMNSSGVPGHGDA